MPKRKYTAFDVAASAAAIRAVALGRALANAREVDGERGDAVMMTFNRRMCDGDGVESSARARVVIDPTSRAHVTSYARVRGGTPSAFVMALRLAARGKKLRDARQLGRDRAMDLTFGQGDGACHVIVELFGRGNVIVTDANYTVARALRTRRDDDALTRVEANHPYSLARFHAWRPYGKADVVSALTTARVVACDGELGVEDGTAVDARRPATLREALCRAFGYSPPIAEHVARAAGVLDGSNAALPFADDVRERYVDGLTRAIEDIESWFEGVTTGKRVADAPRVYTKMDAKADGTDEIEVVDDFAPFELKQNEGRRTKTYELPKGLDPALAFDHYVDEYFHELDSQSVILQRRKAEAQAIARLEKTLRDQKNRVEQLERERELEEQRAVLIEYNHEAVDVAIEAVNSALASGMSWDELEAMIKEERRLGNPVAGMIKSMDLANNEITITLENHLDELGEDEDALGKKKRVAVSVDLGLSAHANASVRFAAKKKNADKFEKTLNAQNKAVAAAESKMKSAMERAANVVVATRARQPLWFEKFHWFITSENCLVIQAKDATQAEMILSRYALPGDAFVHADVPQAPVTVVKPPPGSDVRAVPAYSLVQAGAAVMCRSGAWSSRAVKSAWWIPIERVSKISPVAGDALPPGVVHVAHAEKQFLPHTQLVMGFGLMFVVSEKCEEAHKNDRLIRSDFNILLDEENEEEDEEEEKEISGGDDSESVENEDKEVDKLAAFLDGAVGFAGEGVEGKDSDDDDGDDDRERDDGGDGVDGDAVQSRAPQKAQQPSSSGPRMSAKERKAQKKKKQNRSGRDDSDDADDDFVDPLAALGGGNKKAANKDRADGSSANKPAPRGKAAKLKKIKAKYADQDEEDRELAMKLLGAEGRKKSAGMTKKAARMKEKAANDFEERKLAKPQAPSAPEPAPPKWKRHESAADMSADADVGEAQPKVEMPLEERLKIESERLSIINRIVAFPLRHDEIEYCLPVCAPIAATNGLKYRMKVTPGAQKKGKAAKLAMDILLRAPFATKDELAAARLVNDADTAVCLPSGCKISMPPGAAKILSQNRAAGKAKGKKSKR